MAYASDSLYNLGRTARAVGAIMALLNLTLVVILMFDPADQAPSRRAQFPLALAMVLMGVLPGACMFAFSFPVQRGSVWASVALVAACLWQLPMLILFT